VTEDASKGRGGNVFVHVQHCAANFCFVLHIAQTFYALRDMPEQEGRSPVMLRPAYGSA
jgi:hypothetical protein